MGEFERRGELHARSLPCSLSQVSSACVRMSSARRQLREREGHRTKTLVAGPSSRSGATVAGVEASVCVEAKASFSSSGLYIRGVAEALRGLDQFDAVGRAAPLEVRDMLATPTERSWWGHRESIALTQTIGRVGGLALVRAVGKQAIHQSLSNVVKPLLSVLLATLGESPASLFSRMGWLAQVALRGVEFRWVSFGDSGGELLVEYPLPVPAEYVAWWEGVIQYGVERTPRQLQGIEASHVGGALRFTVHWSERVRPGRGVM